MKLKNAPARKLARQQTAGPDTNLRRSERQPHLVLRSVTALEAARNIRTKKRRTGK